MMRLVLCFSFLFTTLHALEADYTNSRSTPDPWTHLHRLGVPGNGSLRRFENYVLSYDTRLRLATWVFEHLTPRSVAPNRNMTDRNDFNFVEDPSFDRNFRAKLSDYKNNAKALTRGHMAAAANHQISYAHKQNTYFLSNVAPQIGTGFNGGMWNKLEQWVRTLTTKRGNAYVFSGPLFLPQRDAEGEYVLYRLLGTSRIAVPTHFFKAVLANSKDGFNYDFWTFVLPHQDLGSKGSLDQFLVNTISVEKDSGLLFFKGVSKSQIRTQTSTKL